MGGRNLNWSKLKYSGKQMDYEHERQQTAYDREMARVARNTTMPFGKYQGRRFKDIPLNYLQWCVRTFDITASNQRLLLNIQNEIETRSNNKGEQNDQ